MKKKRWSVKEVKEFCGWESLKMVVQAGRTQRDRALLSGLFLTGGRISEVLKLQVDHFKLNLDDTYIIVQTMPRVKAYRKIGPTQKWKCQGHCSMRWNMEPTDEQRKIHGEVVRYDGWFTTPSEEYRTFPIHRSEPVTGHLLKYLGRFDNPGVYLFNIKYPRAYEIAVEAGQHCNIHTPPHWFRAQRASQLAFEYGFTEQDLVEFFKWQDYRTAFHYASKGYKGLTAKMVR